MTGNVYLDLQFVETADTFSPNSMFRDGIAAHNRGQSRNSHSINHPRAIIAFRRGWDRARESQEQYG